MIQYKIVKATEFTPSSIQRQDEDGSMWSIPLNQANTDYQAYLKWIEEGNTPEPAEEIA